MADHVHIKLPTGALAPWSHGNAAPDASDGLARIEAHRVGAASKSEDQAGSFDLKNQTNQGLAEYRAVLDRIAQSDQMDRELDAIMKRLFKALDGRSAPVETDLEAAENVAKRVEIVFYGTSSVDGRSDLPPPGHREGQLTGEGPDPLLSSDRDRLLSKIEAALARLGKLRSRLQGTRDESYGRAVNINTSIAGLNMAKVRADSSDLGINSAADAYNAVMTNLRTSVAAHGKLTPELVRLILS